MYRFYNPNPSGIFTDDCIVRAACKRFGSNLLGGGDMNEEVLYNAEELLMHEIDDIVDAKRNGKQLSTDDICCLEKMLKGV